MTPPPKRRALDAERIGDLLGGLPCDPRTAYGAVAMNTILIQAPMASLLGRPAGGSHRDHRRYRLRKRARSVARASFTDGQDVIGHCLGDTANTGFAGRVRPAWLKSP